MSTDNDDNDTNTYPTPLLLCFAFLFISQHIRCTAPVELEYNKTELHHIFAISSIEAEE